MKWMDHFLSGGQLEGMIIWNVLRSLGIMPVIGLGCCGCKQLEWVTHVQFANRLQAAIWKLAENVSLHDYLLPLIILSSSKSGPNSTQIQVGNYARPMIVIPHFPIPHYLEIMQLTVRRTSQAEISKMRQIWCCCLHHGDRCDDIHNSKRDLWMKPGSRKSHLLRLLIYNYLLLNHSCPPILNHSQVFHLISPRASSLLTISISTSLNPSLLRSPCLRPVNLLFSSSFMDFQSFVIRGGRLWYHWHNKVISWLLLIKGGLDKLRYDGTLDLLHCRRVIGIW